MSDFVSHVSFEVLLHVAARVLSSDTTVPQQEGCRITGLMSQVRLWLADWAVTASTGHGTCEPHICNTLQVQAHQDSPQLCQR